MRSVVRAPRRVKQTAFPNIPVYVSMVRMKIEITPRLSVSEEELRIEFVRAPGPGGQNVNKVATAVQLRFDARHSPSLPEDVRRRLARLAGRRLTSEGILVIHAHARRTQDQNRADAINRLKELIAQAAVPPKRRKATRPTKSSKERRLKQKHQQGDRKNLRGKKYSRDD